jgi:hypothetical protein
VWKNKYDEDPKYLISANPNVPLVFCEIEDIMDQIKTAVPHDTDSAKDFTDDLLIATRLSGSIVHGHSVDGLFDVNEHPKSADINISQMVENLLKLQELYRPLPIFGPNSRFKLQLDNASDNKNHTVLSFAAFLVEEEVFGTVEINTLKPGHTHEDIGNTDIQ